MKRLWTTFLLFGFIMFYVCGCSSETQGEQQDVLEGQDGLQSVSDETFKREIRYHEDGRIILVYSGSNIGQMQRKLINNFNAQNEEYYIEIQDFGKEYGNDITKAYEAFDLSLVNQTAGDILQVNSSFYPKYIRIGAYEDLNPYMDADKEFYGTDYWENIFDACELDGKLYYMPINFGVNAYLGKASVWKGKETMTIDETIEFLNSLPKEQEILCGLTSEEFITDMMNNGSNHFVDWESGKCYFDSEKFKNVLRVADSLPDEYESDGNGGNVSLSWAKGEVLLAEIYQSDYRVLSEIKACMGEDIVMVNYPGSDNVGNSLELLEQHTYAIHSNSLNKEGAWEFIKFALSYEQQSQMEQNSALGTGGLWYIPMNKAVFEKQMEKWQTPRYVLNENGEKVEEPVLLFLSEDIQLEIYHATDEDVALWKQIIENVTSVRENNYVLTNIILEETGPYFDGQKSIDEVAGIIQGRISIYVNENK